MLCKSNNVGNIIDLLTCLGVLNSIFYLLSAIAWGDRDTIKVPNEHSIINEV